MPALSIYPRVGISLFASATDDKFYLSEVNSIYDPIGLIASVAVTGNLLLRELDKETLDWDIPLLDCRKSEWKT